MVTRNKKKFDSVKTFRKIKESISMEIQDMSFDELKKHLSEQPAKSANTSKSSKSIG
jgi:hypothetical protein